MLSLWGVVLACVVITLETGVPGAGKTLYCVDKLVRLFAGAKVKHENAAGELVETDRVIYTNINGLLVEHTKIGPGSEWHHDGKTKTWSQVDGADKFGLNNWHEWAQPGAVIIYDEVQKPWPLAAAGAPVPPCITALETHRHMGVDFIALTQHPMLIHANLVRLVGRHLHVRRMGNMGLAIVYEWDSCSRTLLYKNAIAKAPYRYDKKVFELYKSAELHTKSPRRTPSLIFGILAALGLIGYFGPVAYGRIAERISGKPQVVKTAVDPAVVAAGGVKAPQGAASAPPVVPVVPEMPAAPVAAPVVPVVTGCFVMGPRCSCFESSGARVPLDGASCVDAAASLERVQFAGNSGSVANVVSRVATPVPPSNPASASGPIAEGGWSPLDHPFADMGRAVKNRPFAP